MTTATLVIPVEQFVPGQTRLYLETQTATRRQVAGATRYATLAIEHHHLLASQEQARRALFAAIDRMERELGVAL